MRGEWEDIGAQVFEISEGMTLHFQGASCNIVDGNGDLVENLTDENGSTTREVYPQYRCYVIKARVMFKRFGGEQQLPDEDGQEFRRHVE